MEILKLQSKLKENYEKLLELKEDEGSDYILNKESIIYYYKPLKEYYGNKRLAKLMSEDYEDGEQDEREIGNIDLVEYLYSDAISDIHKKIRKSEMLKCLNSLD